MKTEKQIEKMINITNLMNSIDIIDEQSMCDFSFLSTLLLKVCKDIDNVPMKDMTEYTNLLKKYYIR